MEKQKEQEYKTLISDIRTYRIMNRNENFFQYLSEAYEKLKQANISSYEEFSNCHLGIGAFTYDEITIFERLKDEDYKKLIESSWHKIHNYTEEYIKNENLGEVLQSWASKNPEDWGKPKSR